MTRAELIAVVPIHDYKGRPFFVRLSEVPEPWRTQFWNALAGSAAPAFEGEGRLAYAWDWKDWVSDRWFARPGPTGLDQPAAE